MQSLWYWNKVELTSLDTQNNTFAHNFKHSLWLLHIFCRFVSSDFERTNLEPWKLIISNQLFKKTISKLHIILGFLCWMNERYAQIWSFPLSQFELVGCLRIRMHLDFPKTSTHMCVCVIAKIRKGQVESNKSVEAWGLMEKVGAYMAGMISHDVT